MFDLMNDAELYTFYKKLLASLSDLNRVAYERNSLVATSGTYVELRMLMESVEKEMDFRAFITATNAV